MSLRMTARDLAALTAPTPVRPPQKPRQANPGAVAGCAVREIVLELPLPPAGCSPNRESHAHWRDRSDARWQYRQECADKIPALRAPMFQQATISVEFFHGSAPGRYHARDAQNAIGGIKALVDALVELGYLPDDSARFLHWAETTIHGARESAGRACVVITLRRREAS